MVSVVRCKDANRSHQIGWDISCYGEMQKSCENHIWNARNVVHTYYSCQNKTKWINNNKFILYFIIGSVPSSTELCLCILIACRYRVRTANVCLPVGAIAEQVSRVRKRDWIAATMYCVLVLNYSCETCLCLCSRASHWKHYAVRQYAIWCEVYLYIFEAKIN